MKNIINISIRNRIIASWLILFIFSSFLFISCTTPRSVGYNMKQGKPKVKSTQSPTQENPKSDEKIPKKQITKENEILPINNDKQENKDYDYTFNEQRLPTLREQMKMIDERQNKIEEDLSNVKSTVNEIKNTIEEIKYIIGNNKDLKPVDAIAGEDLKNKTKNSKKDEIDKDVLEGTYFFSDEEINNKTVSEPNKTKEVKQYINRKPKKNQVEQNLNHNKPVDVLNKKQNINKQPQNIDELISDNELDLSAGEKLLINKEFDKAEEFYKKILTKTDANNEDVVKIKLAESLLNQGKVEEAKQVYKDILKQNKKNETLPIAKKMLQQL